MSQLHLRAGAYTLNEGGNGRCLQYLDIDYGLVEPSPGKLHIKFAVRKKTMLETSEKSACTQTRRSKSVLVLKHVQDVMGDIKRKK